jgi:flagellar biosynthesis/type III secretory pathway M-ring protein FliF/YscJ
MTPQGLTPLQQAVLIVGLIVSLVTLISLIFGIWWIRRQSRKQNREEAEAERKKTENETAFRVNLTRDLGDFRNKFKDINDILDKTLRNGLKSDIEAIKNSCLKCSGQVATDLASIKGDLDGKIKVVDQKITDHISDHHESGG